MLEIQWNSKANSIKSINQSILQPIKFQQSNEIHQWNPSINRSIDRWDHDSINECITQSINRQRTDRRSKNKSQVCAGKSISSLIKKSIVESKNNKNWQQSVRKSFTLSMVVRVTHEAYWRSRIPLPVLLLLSWRITPAPGARIFPLPRPATTLIRFPLLPPALLLLPSPTLLLPSRFPFNIRSPLFPPFFIRWIAGIIPQRRSPCSWCWYRWRRTTPDFFLRFLPSWWRIVLSVARFSFTLTWSFVRRGFRVFG